MARVEIEGMRELERALERAVPKNKQLGPIVKDASLPVVESARRRAPIDKGVLRRALMPKLEKAKRGKIKRVSQVTYNRRYTNHFTGQNRDPKPKSRYYYPASQEWGFRLRNGKRKEGLYFMRDAADFNKKLVQNKIVKGILKIVDKGWSR